MQTETGRYRYRGWRESFKLADLAHSVPSDVTTVMEAQLANETAAFALQTPLATLTDTQVAALQHVRAQLRFALRNQN